LDQTLYRLTLILERFRSFNSQMQAENADVHRCLGER